MSGTRVLKFPESEIVSGMDRKYTDKAIYFTIMDASEGKTDFCLVGKNVFKPGKARPKPDEILYDSDLLMEIFHDLKKRLPP